MRKTRNKRAGQEEGQEQAAAERGLPGGDDERPDLGGGVVPCLQLLLQQLVISPAVCHTIPGERTSPEELSWFLQSPGHQ